MASEVTIRKLADQDKADVCRIWVDGLEQSRLAAPWFLRRWFMPKLYELRDTALAATGDVGPEGANLLQTYGDKTDRCMFVAVMGASPKVVGCCAVKKGMDETAPEPDSQIASIWRMSVDEAHRGHGIASKLMDVCEAWAKDHDCSTMRLMTINPAAANFYVARMGYTRTSHFYVIKNPLLRRLIAPVGTFEKPVS